MARFCHWCERRAVGLTEIQPLVVAAYIEQLTLEVAKPTVKLHLAAIRMLFDFLVTGQVVPVNPAASVRGPKHVTRKGKTPVLSAAEARVLLDSIDTRHRRDSGPGVDRLDGLQLRQDFCRIGDECAGLLPQGRRMWFRLHEKGGSCHEVSPTTTRKPIWTRT